MRIAAISWARPAEREQAGGGEGEDGDATVDDSGLELNYDDSEFADFGGEELQQARSGSGEEVNLDLDIDLDLGDDHADVERV